MKFHPRSVQGKNRRAGWPVLIPLIGGRRPMTKRLFGAVVRRIAALPVPPEQTMVGNGRESGDERRPGWRPEHPRDALLRRAGIDWDQSRAAPLAGGDILLVSDAGLLPVKGIE